MLHAGLAPQTPDWLSCCRPRTNRMHASHRRETQHTPVSREYTSSVHRDQPRENSRSTSVARYWSIALTNTMMRGMRPSRRRCAASTDEEPVHPSSLRSSPPFYLAGIQSFLQVSRRVIRNMA
ncbi:hypothetical protein JB92DRAFT_2872001 [Gautieria morchelliformis]|nr:hypothetical protein JB92DRAFT_2872001 [Gautieria morchelliformis]